MTPLDPEEVDALESELREERGRATARLTSLRRSWTDIVAAAEGANLDDEHDPEGTTIAFEREQVSAQIARTERHLAELDAALQRVREGTIGVCEICGGSIPLERLTARPATRVCVACAEGG